MNIDEKITGIIRSLPVKQQMGLWVILHDQKPGSISVAFRSSEFASKLRKYILKDAQSDEAKYGKLIGGVLSGLSRNGILIKISGDRDALWAVPKEITKNRDKYKAAILDVKVYWERR